MHSRFPSYFLSGAILHSNTDLSALHRSCAMSDMWNVCLSIWLSVENMLVLSFDCFLLVVYCRRLPFSVCFDWYKRSRYRFKVGLIFGLLLLVSFYYFTMMSGFGW